MLVPKAIVKRIPIWSISRPDETEFLCEGNFGNDYWTHKGLFIKSDLIYFDNHSSAAEKLQSLITEEDSHIYFIETVYIYE